MIAAIALMMTQPEVAAIPFGTLGSWCASHDMQKSQACDSYMIGFTDALIATADRAEGHSQCALTVSDLRARFEEAYVGAGIEDHSEPARNIILAIMQREPGCSEAR